MDDDENSAYVDLNYKKYKTTVRKTDKGLQLKIFESSAKKISIT